MRKALFALLLIALAAPAAARGAVTDRRPEAARTPLVDEILLVDGTVLSGHIVAETDSSITIETASLGRVEVQRAQIQRLAKAGIRYGVADDPDCNSVLLTPTPATVGKGDAYFRNFELLILNGGYGITENLDLSIATLFPIGGDWNFIAVGLKAELVDRETHDLGLAITGSHLIAPDAQRFSSLAVVVGIGDRRRSLSVAADRGFNEDGEAATRVMVGGDLQINRRTKLFAEWASSELAFSFGGDDDDDDEFDGFMTLGVRFFGERMAFTLGGFRPVSADTGSLLFLPLAMFSVH
ncbi:hypothetical protein FJ251_14330 [bacterium]|nr:hypothetical protein [bacterium]